MKAEHRQPLRISLALTILLLLPGTLRAEILTYDVRGQFTSGDLVGQQVAVFFTYDTENFDDFAGFAPVDVVGIRVPGVLDVTTADFATIERSLVGTFALNVGFLEFGGDLDGGSLGLGINMTFSAPVDLAVGLPLSALSSTELFLNVFLEQERFSGAFTTADPTAVTLRGTTAVPAPNPAALLVLGVVLALVRRGSPPSQANGAAQRRRNEDTLRHPGELVTREYANLGPRRASPNWG